ncbi:protein kinase [Cryptosporidium bovis]|uniref:protein kinase n=1 Tax=Cryptosporidium bovis TaxID=310047 RepID=UPI00351A80A4|nr:protein kinase [Cryptosporidium bovis]
MWDEAIKTIGNIIEVNKNNIDNLPTKILNFFNLYIEKNVKKLANSLSEFILEFDDVFDLIGTFIEHMNEEKKDIDYNSYYLNDLKEGFIRNCFIEFENESELNNWIKDLLIEQIFAKSNLDMIGVDTEIGFKSIVSEYQNTEILPFHLPIEFYKLFFDSLKLFLSNQNIHRETSEITFNKIGSSYSDLSNFLFDSDFNFYIIKYLEENHSLNCLDQIDVNLSRDVTFSQKVEDEKLKIKMEKKTKMCSYFRHDNIINISFSMENIVNKESNMKTTLHDLYKEYFKLASLDNEDEINMCMNSSNIKKDLKLGDDFREFLRTNFSNIVLNSKFLLVKCLYNGNFSDIYVGVNIITYKLHCIKKIKGNIYEKGYLENSLKEANTIRGLNDSTISRFIPVYEDTIVENGSLFIVTELLGDNLLILNEVLHRRKDELLIFEVIQRIIRQLLLCLRDLHEKYELIHCDIKPENIVLNSIDSFDILGYFNRNINQCFEFDIKLIDWGSCIKKCQSSSMQNSYLQSRYYRSPEICLGLPFDEKIDIWSVGCIMVELITGKPLFMGVKTTQQLLANMVYVLGKIPPSMIIKSTTLKHFLTFDGHIYERTNSNRMRVYTKLNGKCFYRENLRELLDCVDESLLDLIGQLLSIDPKERPSASKALEHPWFQCDYINLV